MKKIFLITALILCLLVISCGSEDTPGDSTVSDSENAISEYVGKDEVNGTQNDFVPEILYISQGYKDTSLIGIGDRSAGAVTVNSYAELCAAVGRDDLSEHKLLKEFDKAFFEVNTLVIVEAVASTSAVDCDISVSLNGGIIDVTVTEGRLPSGVEGPCVLCNWTFFVVLNKYDSYSVNVTKY